MAKEVFFAILRENGELRKRTGRAAHLYTTEKTAVKFATRDGDTVVRLTLDRNEQPVFIRTLKLDPNAN